MTTFRNNLFGKQRWLLSLLLFAVSFEFMACGAADIQSAKAYRQRRDYVRADEMLQKALKEEPTNDEAWYLYIVNLYDLKQFEKIATQIDTAMLYSTSHRGELADLKRNTWIELYNGGLGAYNANPESKEAQQAAIGYLEAARQLAPDQPETYDLLGNIYIEGVHDTAKAVETFSQELNSVSASHQQGIATGLMLNMSPSSVERAIGGAPARIQMIPVTQSDSAMIYVYPSKQAYIYFLRAQKAPRDWQLMGWRFTPVETQGLQPLGVSRNAYLFVANNSYQSGVAALARHDTAAAFADFDKAIPLLVTLQQINPGDEDAARLLPDIYKRTNRTEKAKEEYKKLLAEHPSKEYYVNYGYMLMNSQDYQGASEAFQKALEFDANYQPALYDLAATYRNWAKADQEAKRAPDARAKLEKSTQYFERLHVIDKTSFEVIAQLFDSYKLLKQKDKAVTLLAEMEGWKNGEPANHADYWKLLGQLYAFTDHPKESEAAFKRADQLGTP
jgi:tetratricopeptide (TPR) repeat protein